MINDAGIVAIYSILTALVITTTVISLVQNVVKELARTYAALGFCAIGWFASAIVYHLTTDPVSAAYAEHVPFLFISICPVILFIFALRFYNSDLSIPIQYHILLYVIPFLTSCVSLFPQLQWMLRTNYQVLSIEPLHTTTFTWNFWFYIHLAYSYLLMMASSILVVKQHIKRSISNSLPSWLMVSGITVTYLFNIMTLTSPLPAGDYTLIGTSLAIVIFYFAIINNPTVEYLALARNALFSHIDLPVLILNKEKKVLELNVAAASFLNRVGHSFAVPFSYDDMMRDIKNHSLVINRVNTANESGNIFIPQNGNNTAYSFAQREVLNRKGQVIGQYIIILEITQLSQWISELEHVAGVDPLTGIANRRSFDEKRDAFNAEEFLPVAIIMGDVNRLKYVNDNMGHHLGDKLLKTVAQTLSDLCPEEGIAARIGGDEFVMMIPRFQEEAAQKLVQELGRGVREKVEEYGGASIALGLTIRTSMQQDIDTLIEAADKEMYRNKQNDRRR